MFNSIRRSILIMRKNRICSNVDVCNMIIEDYDNMPDRYARRMQLHVLRVYSERKVILEHKLQHINKVLSSM